MFYSMSHGIMDVDKVANARIMAAVVHKDKEIISLGWNKKKSHPFQARFSKNEDCIYLHAEVDAIKNALKRDRLSGSEDLSDCSLFVFRMKKESKKGPYITGLAKPCEGCMRAIVTFGIKNVYFSEDNKKEFSCL